LGGGEKRGVPDRKERVVKFSLNFFLTNLRAYRVLKEKEKTMKADHRRLWPVSKEAKEGDGRHREECGIRQSGKKR